MRYSLELPYPPFSGNTSTRFGRGRHYTRPEIVGYRQRVAIWCASHGLAGLVLPGPLEVLYTLYPPDLRARDEDNVLKVVKDALTRARVWVDDSNRVIVRSVVEWGEVVALGRVCITLVHGEHSK